MATISNRSRFSVSVPRRPELARTFPYNAEKDAGVGGSNPLTPTIIPSKQKPTRSLPEPAADVSVCFCILRCNLQSAGVCRLRGAIPEDDAYYAPFSAAWGVAFTTDTR